MYVINIFSGTVFCKTSSIFINKYWQRFYIYAQMYEILYINIFDIFANFEPNIFQTYPIH